MQILPSGAANAAAGSVSQATSKDRSSGSPSDVAHVLSATQIEKVARSEATSADRDAQGGGQGLGDHGKRNSKDESDPVAAAAALHVPPEPPCELDIVG